MQDALAGVRGAVEKTRPMAVLSPPVEIMKHLAPLNGWGRPKPSAAREVALSTKVPNFGTEMTMMLLEAALALGVRMR